MPNTPGQPGGGGGPGRGGPQRRRRNQSRYSTQLEEKQGLKSVFGIRETQLKNYYGEAKQGGQETGPRMIQLLERRLDNAVYRAGLAGTRKQARQMTSHRLFEVNGQAVDVPSYRLGVGDVVKVRENKKGKSYFSNFEKRMQNVQVPTWLELIPEDFGFKVTAEPTEEEAKLGVDIQAVVEFLSR